MILRHGDLNFRTIEALPKGKVKKVANFILAEGEYTGHNHNLVANEGTKLSVIDAGSDIYFDVVGGTAELTHPEHKKITFEPGIYHMKKEREYSYFDMEIRKVVD